MKIRFNVTSKLASCALKTIGRPLMYMAPLADEFGEAGLESDIEGWQQLAAWNHGSAEASWYAYGHQFFYALDFEVSIFQGTFKCRVSVQMLIRYSVVLVGKPTAEDKVCFIWIGGGGIISHTHYDMSHNMFVPFPSQSLNSPRTVCSRIKWMAYVHVVFAQHSVKHYGLLVPF